MIKIQKISYGGQTKVFFFLKKTYINAKTEEGKSCISHEEILICCKEYFIKIFFLTIIYMPYQILSLFSLESTRNMKAVVFPLIVIKITVLTLKRASRPNGFNSSFFSFFFFAQNFFDTLKYEIVYYAHNLFINEYLYPRSI